MHEVCVFKVNDRRCSVLTKKACMRCNFYMTEEEFKARREKAEERLKSLSPEKQREIVDKYMCGGGNP